ncbi:MAG: penicillin-binding protein activator [Alphaproteobacteria bacterium]|nr:penicillin-binding protein activator [Alphaproteobacteria bacterium]
MKKFALCSLLFALCACGTGNKWADYYGTAPVGDATDLNAPTRGGGTQKTVAVILPDSDLGSSVRTSVQMAFVQRRPEDITVRFTDLSGSADARAAQMESALGQNPDLIIGPIFAEDADTLRRLKPDHTPVLSFTSDATALGDGIMTMSLIPNQSVETIIRRMSAEGRKDIMIFAPDNPSGYIMGNAALDAAKIYGLKTQGFYFYTSGNMDSMKSAAQNATMFDARGKANTRAKEILSDILMNRTLTAAERASVDKQLEERNKSDTIGDLPFDAVLFLGNAGDSKALGSFLRYFDAPARRVKFFGTAMWDTPAMFKDMTFSGASFAALPAISPEFANIYRDITDREPERISPMGYDAAILAIRALHAPQDAGAYLMDPSGFRGLDGLIRLQPNGQSQRALQIMTLDASGTPKIAAPAATNFIRPLYQLSGQNSTRPYEIKVSGGINPMDYLRLPESLHGKYSAKTYRAGTDKNTNNESRITNPEEIVILPEDSSDPVLADPDFQPVELETVTRVLVDEVEVR